MEKRFTRDQLLKKNIKPVIKPRPPKSKLKETPKPKPKLEECKHKNIARDDYLKTCTSCGTVLKEDTLVPSTLYEHKLIIKKTSKNNEIKTKSAWYFRDMLEDKKVPELKNLAVGSTRKLKKGEIIEKIRSGVKNEDQKMTISDLRTIAKEKGIKYICSLSKKELIEKLENKKDDDDEITKKL